MKGKPRIGQRKRPVGTSNVALLNLHLSKLDQKINACGVYHSRYHHSHFTPKLTEMQQLRQTFSFWNYEKSPWMILAPWKFLAWENKKCKMEIPLVVAVFMFFGSAWAAAIYFLKLKLSQPLLKTTILAECSVSGELRQQLFFCCFMIWSIGDPEVECRLCAKRQIPFRMTQKKFCWLVSEKGEVKCTFCASIYSTKQHLRTSDNLNLTSSLAN